MNLIFSDFTIVILATANNPSILNPDFLRINKVVGEEFKPIEVITTPPFALVKYEGGIIINADSERLTFGDSKEDRILDDSPIPEMAIKYIKTLPHAPYKAIGINFNGYCKCTEMLPEKFILDKFIKEGPWSKRLSVEPLMTLSFAYKQGDVTYNLNTAPATTKREGETFPSLAINSNIHCSPENASTESLIKYITDWKTYFNELRELIVDIIE